MFKVSTCHLEAIVINKKLNPLLFFFPNMRTELRVATHKTTNDLDS